MADLKAIILQMSIEDKLCQLTQCCGEVFIGDGSVATGPKARSGLNDEMLNKIGSVLNFANCDDAIKVQKEHMENDPNKIPMVFMMDVIHGFRTIYPIPLAMGCSFDTELMKECCQMASREAVAGGIHATFGPMVDYSRDARWGRVMESCGEDVLLNSRMGAAQVEGFQGEDLKDKKSIAACVKHFAGYGGAEAGLDYTGVELSEHTLREFYLPAYKACIDAGVSLLMPSFNVLNGVPSTANKWLMQDILKKEWDYKGVVISDWAAMSELVDHGVAKDENEAARLAFANEVDIEMCVTAIYVNHIGKMIEEGVFTEEQLDRMVLRVLELKEKLGLFEDPYRGASADAEKREFLSEKNREIARRAAEESAVLLKNDGVLPLSKNIKKIALIGPFADNNAIKGFWSCNGRDEETVTIKQGIEKLVPNAEITVVKGCTNDFGDKDTSGFKAAIKAAKKSDIVVLCLGEKQDQSGEGNSRTTLNLPGVQSELAKEIAKVNKNTVAVTFSGRPLTLGELHESVPAILHIWFPGTEGGNAIANLLFGDANPCGKIAMTFPKNVGQCPIYYNHRSTGRMKDPELDGQHIMYMTNYIDSGNLPQYSFGHGLSYSNFVYEDLKLSSDSLTADGEIKVSVTVHNDSDVAGKEVVMLYMRDLVASTARPIQQLLDFKKVCFEAGERKNVEFTVREPQLRFYNPENKHVSEPGEFLISTGYADHLIHTKKFILE